MGKCTWLIEKGKKKGQECGIYTNKKIDDKFYCNSHYNMKNSKNDEIKDENSKINEKVEIDNIVKPEEVLIEKSIDNGDPYEDVIEYEYKKNKLNSSPENDTHQIKQLLKTAINKLEIIENAIFTTKRQYNKCDIPDFEEFDN